MTLTYFSAVVGTPYRLAGPVDSIGFGFVDIFLILDHFNAFGIHTSIYHCFIRVYNTCMFIAYFFIRVYNTCIFIAYFFIRICNYMIIAFVWRLIRNFEFIDFPFFKYFVID